MKVISLDNIKLAYMHVGQLMKKLLFLKCHCIMNALFLNSKIDEAMNVNI